MTSIPDTYQAYAAREQIARLRATVTEYRANEPNPDLGADDNHFFRYGYLLNSIEYLLGLFGDGHETAMDLLREAARVQHTTDVPGIADYAISDLLADPAVAKIEILVLERENGVPARCEATVYVPGWGHVYGHSHDPVTAAAAARDLLAEARRTPVKAGAL